MEGNSTWTDVDSAPIPTWAEEFHLITGLTGEVHQHFRPKVLYALYQTLN